jgi:hypothetical protein
MDDEPNITLDMISDDEVDLGEYSNVGNIEPIVNDITDVMNTNDASGVWGENEHNSIHTSNPILMEESIDNLHDIMEELEEEAVAEEAGQEEAVADEAGQEEAVAEEVLAEEAVQEEAVEEEAVQAEAVAEEAVQAEATNIHKMVFIVPYRNRESHLAFFKEHMQKILEDYDASTYEIYYIHQCDNRGFNRGAMKNIGFLFVKNKYPKHYKNITLVFNDVDSMPIRKNMIHYETTRGVIKHFFGFEYTLGGIVSIKAGEFEMLNGFPNFWAWGYEDNLLQQRVVKANLKIDRSTFFPIGDKNIIHLNDGPLREVNQGEFNRYARNTYEGIYSIKKLEYALDEETGFVNVKWFETGQIPDVNKYRWHHLKDGPAPYDTKFGLMYNNRRIQNGAKMSMHI